MERLEEAAEIDDGRWKVSQEVSDEVKKERKGKLMICEIDQRVARLPLTSK